MKVLVVGGGGREHALAWKLAQSKHVEEVIVAPGNAGTALEPKVRNATVAAEDIEALLKLAKEEHVSLTVIGPEAPLAAGIVDRFWNNGLRCYGPRKQAARLESSKTFAKEFMVRHRIPTAHHASFTDLEEARAYLEEAGAPIVIKADGLAAGKGVVVAQTLEEAHAAVTDMLGDRRFGDAGARVVIEEFLTGEEASFIAMVGVDGAILPLATSQDHKARDDGDKGPNTGGMGAYSPAPVVTDAIAQRVINEVLRPVIEGLREEGVRYTGFLYAGLMIGPDGTPKVLEFNCRFGDPETQPILFRLKSDLLLLIEAALEGKLAKTKADWDPRPAVGVVMAAGGYPGEYRKGDVIIGLPPAGAPSGANPPVSKVFHAGTGRNERDQIVTRGGRVLCVVGTGDTVKAAQAEAYRVVDQIRFEGALYRHDIGYRAIARGL
jgi:phosphoribosylamine--glycine ligase